MLLSHQAVTLDTRTPDKDARLVFRDGRLVAVLTRLSDIHAKLEGHWFIEATFGEIAEEQPPTFATWQQFEDWLTAGLS